MTQPRQLTLWRSGPVEVTDEGLHLKHALSPEEWGTALIEICRTRDAMTFALGDLLATLDDRTWRGDDRVQAVLQETNLRLGSLAEYRRQAQFYPPEVRREMLDKAHKREAGETGNFHLRWRHFHIASRFTDPEVRKAALQEAIDNAWTCDEFYDHVRKAQNTQRWHEQTWPAGTYGLILADFPWEYEHCASNTRSIPLNQYPVMTLEQGYAMASHVLALAAPDCVLYFWATSPKLAEALTMIEKWGFEYRTDMVWVKDLMGMGYWARQRHEALLVATRGKPMPPPEDKRPDSVIVAPRREHSEKPGEVYALLEEAYPDVPKVELFARPPYREGWAHWGNEAQPGEEPPEERRGVLLRMAEEVA